MGLVPLPRHGRSMGMRRLGNDPRPGIRTPMWPRLWAGTRPLDLAVGLDIAAGARIDAGPMP
jgi:hypothetical protein